jgi:hypothetical protein
MIVVAEPEGFGGLLSLQICKTHPNNDMYHDPLVRPVLVVPSRTKPNSMTAICGVAKHCGTVLVSDAEMPPHPKGIRNIAQSAKIIRTKRPRTCPGATVFFLGLLYSKLMILEFPSLPCSCMVANAPG